MSIFGHKHLFYKFCYFSCYKISKTFVIGSYVKLNCKYWSHIITSKIVVKSLKNDNFCQKMWLNFFKTLVHNADKKQPRSNKCALCDWSGVGMKAHWSQVHSTETLPFACDVQGMNWVYASEHFKSSHATFLLFHCSFIYYTLCSNSIHTRSKICFY